MSNTDAIDEKKKATRKNPNDLSSNIVNFLVSVLSLIILVIIYFSLSGLVLYGCKLGQSNILPTNIHCYPYTSENPTFPNGDAGIPINIFTTFTDPQMSMKINFPYKTNSTNTLLDILRNYKETPQSNFLANYFISILESLLCFNYSSFNFILNSFNKLPEILVIIFGPILFLFAFLFVFLADHIYLIYLWFASMDWFFKQNTNTNGSSDEKPNWKYVSMLDTVDYLCAIFFVFLFLVLFWVLLLGLPVLPFITICFCLISGLSYSGIMNGKQATCLTIIKEMFKTYKISIMSIFSILVVTSAFANLGNISGVFSIITLCLIYWGIITIDLFKSNKEGAFSVLSSYEQAKKICDFKDNKKKHGLFYNLVFGQNAGGNISHKLKKIGKNLREI